MMNLEYAKKQFDKYLDDYNREDDKIKLKIVHTYGVTACSRKIAQGLKLSEEDCQLAELIGLLHDIGRFEQLKRFDSFEPDTMDHASFGVQILFEEGMIKGREAISLNLNLTKEKETSSGSKIKLLEPK